MEESASKKPVTNQGWGKFIYLFVCVSIDNLLTFWIILLDPKHLNLIKDL